MPTIAVSDMTYRQVRKMADDQMRSQKSIITLAVHKYFIDNPVNAQDADDDQASENQTGE